jgi:hypothetical protein
MNEIPFDQGDEQVDRRVKKDPSDTFATIGTAVLLTGALLLVVIFLLGLIWKLFSFMFL